MSAPDTDTEKKNVAHRFPIMGMIGVVVFALILLFALVMWISYDGNNPGEDEMKSDVSSGVTEDPLTVEGASEPATE